MPTTKTIELPEKIEFEKLKEEDIFAEEYLKIYKRRVTKDVLFCEYGKPTEEYNISAISLIIVLTGIAILFYILIKYVQGENYAHDVDVIIVQTLMVLTFILIGFALHITFVNRKPKIEVSGSNILLNIGVGIGIGAVALLFQSAVRGLLTFSISSVDYLLFFVVVGIGEEILFRFGMQPTIKILFNFNKLLASIMSIIISAGLFTVVHMFIYTETIDLFIVFVVGCLFGLGLEVTKSMDTPLLAHVLLNLVAGINFVNTYMGGF